MKILWVFAHPERRSLNGALLDDGLRALAELGHEVQVSDLYGMGWNPVVDRADFPGVQDGHVRDGHVQDAHTQDGRTPADRLYVGDAQERAHAQDGMSPDIRAEQRKISWADAIVLHFPLWWFGPPAILKGWFDRVLVQGFAFGLEDGQGRTLRYGDGGLHGKRGLIVTSVGARESSFGPRGIHGHIDEVLFPVQHGTFFYTGMAALRPFVVHGADRMTEAGYKEYAQDLRDRLRDLPTETPVQYRSEGGGDYDEGLVLRDGLAPGRTGLGIHRTG